jgi:hypothetical protein
MEIPNLIVDVTMGLFFGSQNSFDPDKDIKLLDGKVILVTGGTAPYLS